jgi:glutamate racemase
MNKEFTRIIITDSGLGGLSVAAKIERELRKLKMGGNIELIFFNALADSNSGYNRMNNEEDKINTFNSALNGMVSRFDPQLIVIACNTLSVIYPKTKFAQKCKIPVLEIIKAGVDIIYKNLKSDERSAAVILGTETTVNSRVHQTELSSRGIPKSRIINQPCKYLESEIQKDPNSHEVRNLIAEYITQSLEKIETTAEKIIFTLCCTHYSFSKNIFEEEIKKRTTKDYELINPNEMLENDTIQMIRDSLEANTGKGERSIGVVSRFEMPFEELQIISKLLEKDSTSFARALLNYEHDKGLFEYPAK